MCGVKLCGSCTFVTHSQKSCKSYKCLACVGADLFYEQLRDKAKNIQLRTEHHLSGKKILEKYAAQILFFEFCDMVDILNRLLMFDTLKQMWPLLLEIVKYQEENEMEGHLEALQVVRFHAEPRALHSELVRRVALQSATWTERRRREAYPNAPTLLAVRAAVPTLGFAFYDLHGLAPILQLLSAALHQLLERADIRVHILAVRSPNLEVPLVRSLHTAFSERGCWHKVYDDKSGILPKLKEMSSKQLKKFRQILRQIGMTAMFDCIGSSAAGSEAFRGLCRPGSEARCVVDFLNSACLPWDSHCYSGIILDPTLSAAVPLEDPGADKFWNISCWQPPMTDSISGLNRDKRTVFRHGTGQIFGIHCPVDLTRISEECLEQLLDLLLDLPDSVLCYYGLPLTQVISTMNNMKHYAVKRGRAENYFKDRVDWWGHYPIGDHGQRMRDKVHVCLALGPSTGHTGVNVALCTGVPVAMVEETFRAVFRPACSACAGLVLWLCQTVVVGLGFWSGSCTGIQGCSRYCRTFWIIRRTTVLVSSTINAPPMTLLSLPKRFTRALTAILLRGSSSAANQKRRIFHSTRTGSSNGPPQHCCGKAMMS